MAEVKAVRVLSSTLSNYWSGCNFSVASNLAQGGAVHRQSLKKQMWISTYQ
jgi:hypothetical protein